MLSSYKMIAELLIAVPLPGGLYDIAINPNPHTSIDGTTELLTGSVAPFFHYFPEDVHFFTDHINEDMHYESEKNTFRPCV